ncbi:TetR/AcrR family transcriptional regulator [Leekyejoonella antrihumi]|nr:TetR/AcrR family transcriptional regulator [Leekyejoonella antrihumi]
MFAEKGYDGTNFEEIAAQVDLRGPTLYHYFSSKEDLFSQCVEHSFAQVVTRLEEIAGSEGAAEERLRRLFFEQVLIELRDFPDFVPLFLKVYVPVPSLRRRLAAIRRQHGDVFRHVVNEVVMAHGLDPEAAKISLMMAFGSLAYMPEWYDRRGPLRLEELAADVADTLMAPFLGR